MSQIQEQLPKFERHARALENSTCRQIKNRFSDGKGGFCAAGIIAMEFGWNGHGMYIFLDETKFIDYDIFTKIHYLNDVKGMNKQEIADWLREQQ